MVTCNFCKKNISNKYNLKTHQKTKSCMSKQGKHISINYCSCGKTFSSLKGYKTHVDTCTVTQVGDETKRELEQMKIEAKKQKQQMKNKAKKQKHMYETKITELQGIIQKLEQAAILQKQEYERKEKNLQDRIQELATKAIEKPTTSNTTNILNLTPFNMEDLSIKDKISELYNLEYLRKGYKGVAEFTKENLLTDEKGKLKYVCCDPSRLIFKYRDEKGEMRKDVKASRLTNKITPGILIKAHSIVIDEVNKIPTESARNIEFYDMYFKLKELENKPEKLGNELKKITTS